MSYLTWDGQHMAPGQLAPIEAFEQELTAVMYQPLMLNAVGRNRPILGSARDAGNSDPTVLRQGLLLTKTADGKAFTHWGGVVDKDTDKIEGILLINLKVTANGSNRNRVVGHILIGGYPKVDGIIVPGNASAGLVGDDDEDAIREQTRLAFKWEDDPFGHKAIAAAEAV
jgi:hypothetical protein